MIVEDASTRDTTGLATLFSECFAMSYDLVPGPMLAVPALASWADINGHNYAQFYVSKHKFMAVDGSCKTKQLIESYSYRRISAHSTSMVGIMCSDLCNVNNIIMCTRSPTSCDYCAQSLSTYLLHLSVTTNIKMKNHIKDEYFED